MDGGICVCPVGASFCGKEQGIRGSAEAQYPKLAFAQGDYLKEVIRLGTSGIEDVFGRVDRIAEQVGTFEKVRRVDAGRIVFESGEIPVIVYGLGVVAVAPFVDPGVGFRLGIGPFFAGEE